MVRSAFFQTKEGLFFLGDFYWEKWHDERLVPLDARRGTEIYSNRGYHET